MKRIKYFIMILIFVYVIYTTFQEFGFLSGTQKIDDRYYLDKSVVELNESVDVIRDRQNNNAIVVGPNVYALNHNDAIIIGLCIKFNNETDESSKTKVGYFIIDKNTEVISTGLTYKTFYKRLNAYGIKEFRLLNSSTYKGNLE